MGAPQPTVGLLRSCPASEAQSENKRVQDYANEAFPALTECTVLRTVVERAEGEGNERRRW